MSEHAPTNCPKCGAEFNRAGEWLEYWKCGASRYICCADTNDVCESVECLQRQLAATAAAALELANAAGALDEAMLSQKQQEAFSARVRMKWAGLRTALEPFKSQLAAQPTERKPHDA